MFEYASVLSSFCSRDRIVFLISLLLAVKVAVDAVEEHLPTVRPTPVEALLDQLGEFI